MAKGTRKKATKVVESALLNALKYVRLVQVEHGSFGQTHCRIGNGQIVAFDGITAIGVPFEEEIEACPHTLRLIDALEKCAGNLSVTMLAGRMQIKDAEDFTAFIECIDENELPSAWGDPRNWPLNDHFRAAAKIAGSYNTDGGQTVTESSVLMLEGSLFGTDGHAIVEAYHGIPTPPYQVIPKSFFTILNKIDLKIEGFGFQPDTTFTVWFEGGAWLRTQQYPEAYPDLNHVMSFFTNASPTEVTPKLFDAVRKIAPFSADNRVYFHENLLKSHDAENKGASVVVPGLPAGLSINAPRLMKVMEYIKTIDLGLATDCPGVVWFGDMGEESPLKIRGAVVKYS